MEKRKSRHPIPPKRQLRIFTARMIGLCSFAVIELVVLFSLMSAGRVTQRELQTQVNMAQISESVQSAFTPTPAPSPIVFDAKEELIQAVITSDYVRGTRAEMYLVEAAAAPYCTYENLSLMARILERETGIDWPDNAVLMIGEVVMNRVNSPLFPDTVRDVLYQTGPVQYAPVYASDWDFMPSERYVRLAWRALEGERPLNDPDVIWQALFPQGSEIVAFYTDPILGTTTYFCK